MDAEAAGIVWRMGLTDRASELASTANAERERAERLDRDAERLAEEPA
ncbi:MAG TPA: hypothetical protein VGK20_04020 [Candidatus Binatia bacterium]|jgi:hypothetical protein